MNAPENIFLPDVQASLDERNIVIQKVGILEGFSSAKSQNLF